VSVISRDEVRLDDLDRQVNEEGFELPRERLGAAPWTPEPDAVEALMTKIRAQGIPLAEYAQSKPLYGIKTGLNEAFLIDTAIRDRLVAEDPRSAEILKPYLRGQDVQRWRAQANGLWMILLKSSDDHEWPWSSLGAEEAEGLFASTFPALHRHLARWRDQLIARSDQGRFWWELRRCSYYSEFERPKIVYQDIVWESEFALTESELYCNNTTYFISNADAWLLAVLSSPLLWWYSWRTAQHAKDEALRFFSQFVEALPVAVPRDPQAAAVRSIAGKLISVTDEQTQIRSLLIDWLKIEHEVIKPSKRLEDLSLSPEDLIEEVRRARGKKKPLSAAALRSLRDEHARTIAPFAERLREAGRLEAELSDLVCQAYKLTPEEIDLMWQTAPPRMPIGRPGPGPTGR
jgi:hypothetical protein